MGLMVSLGFGGMAGMGETGALVLVELSFRRQTGVGRRGQRSLGVCARSLDMRGRGGWSLAGFERRGGRAAPVCEVMELMRRGASASSSACG